MDFWLPLIHAPGDDTDQIFETAQTAEAAIQAQPSFSNLNIRSRPADQVGQRALRRLLHPGGTARTVKTSFLVPVVLAVLYVPGRFFPRRPRQGARCRHSRPSR